MRCILDIFRNKTTSSGHSKGKRRIKMGSCARLSV
jgi:hypothetical protein